MKSVIKLYQTALPIGTWIHKTIFTKKQWKYLPSHSKNK